jgi:chaperone modulatory protein CbpM
MSEMTHLLNGELIGEGDWLTVTEICRLGRVDATAVEELIELGLLAPRGGEAGDWEFPAAALPRLRVVGRLMRDLGVNVSGAALAVELLEAQRELERQIHQLERLLAGTR